MFKKLIKTRNVTVNHKRYSISISELKKKINCFENFIIVNDGNQFKIFDRVCDHAGGKLVNHGQKFICPIHQWEFDPQQGIYKNNIKKKEIKFQIKRKKILFSIKNKIPEIKSIIKSKKDSIIKLKYFNHAFLVFESVDFKFATDPWAIGSAFANGWWLDTPTEGNWKREIDTCDFVFISHNHPDHLHYKTLSECNKNINIVTPNFKNKSTFNLLNSWNFKNIFNLEFNTDYRFKNTDFIFSILKSGDFRDDSGLYFSYRNFKTLLDVDSNFINFGKLPEVDLYCSSYAGGATAYPLMFDNYNLEFKKNRQKIDSLYLLKDRLKNIKLTKSKYFLPYAGSFKTKLNRDNFITKNLYKNSIDDYKSLLQDQNIKVLDYRKNKQFIFKNNKLYKVKSKNSGNIIIKQVSIEKNLKDFKVSNPIDKKLITDYFHNSGFIDNLYLKINLVDDLFRKDKLIFFVIFEKETKVLFKRSLSKNYTSNLKYLNLKIRSESFMHVIKNKLPWEDLLIGFQCKVFRKPNIYNVDFWNYFTFIYINGHHSRSSYNCRNTCALIDSKIDSKISKSKKIYEATKV